MKKLSTGQLQICPLWESGRKENLQFKYCEWESVYLSPGIEVVVCLRRVDFRQQESRLWASMFSVDVARHGEACLQDLLSVIQRSLKQLLKVLILWHFLVACLSPLSNSLKLNWTKKFITYAFFYLSTFLKIQNEAFWCRQTRFLLRPVSPLRGR